MTETESGAQTKEPFDGPREGQTEDGGRETHHVPGEDVLGKIKEIIRQGNVQRIIIKNEEGRTLVEVPVTVGVVGALVAPVWAAIGAIAAVVTRCSIEVERHEDE